MKTRKPDPEFAKFQEVIKHDGAKWREMTSSNGLTVTTTGSFKEIMKWKWTECLILVDAQGNQVGQIDKMGEVINAGGEVIPYGRHVLRMLNRYKRAYKKDVREPGVRDFIEEWSVAQVYSLGKTGLCVRESMNDNSHEWNLNHKLDRMDAIHHLVDIGNFPRWIKAAGHYWLVRIPTKTIWIYRQFLLMEQIDGGLSLEDITLKPRNKKMEIKLKENFPDKVSWDGETLTIDENFKKDAQEKYNFLVKRLEEEYKLHQKDFLPDYPTFQSLFRDLKPANISVEKLETPRGWSDIGFWIIDQ